MYEELEVEVQDNVSSVDAVRQMMDKMASGDVTGANDAFNAVMGERVGEMLAAKKQEMANSVFNSPGMSEMGLAPEEESTDEEDI